MGQETTTLQDNERDDLAAKKGEVGDEAVEAAGKGVNDVQTGETGQDHSTEDYEKTLPREGVGASQDNSLIKENVAHIEDEE